MFLSYVLAVVAAGFNAASNVLQRKANRDEPRELSMRPRLLLDLVHRPVWLAGFGTIVASFLLTAAALGMGRLAAVQPILVLELPLTLLAGARVFHSNLSGREWLGAGILTVGLAGLIASLAPSAGNNGSAPVSDWAIATATTAGLVVTVVILAVTGKGGRRPALLGVATGMTFGLTAAFMKGMTAAFDHGLIGVLSAWQTYAMAVCGFAGIFLLQNALHAGRLIVAQPGITLADPAVAIIWGVFVFDETTRGGPFLIAAVLSGALMAGGAVVLTRSPLLEGTAATEEQGGRREGTGQATEREGTGREGTGREGTGREGTARDTRVRGTEGSGAPRRAHAS